MTASKRLGCDNLFAHNLKCWAKDKKSIKRVWIYGSRAKGKHSDQSDLDIAIELMFSEFETNLAHFSLDRAKWAHEIQTMSEYSVDLELYHHDCTPIVCSGVQEAAVLIYEKD